MKLSYAWSMPNKWTFQMRPIEELILRYIYRTKPKSILVPFAGEYRFDHPNVDYIDLNNYPGVIRGDALELLPALEKKYDLIISDPPYSMFQAVHTYGNKKLQDITYCKLQYDRLLKPKGYIIHCGYNSSGLGNLRGYEKRELLIVNCGGSHNDYLILVERKLTNLESFLP